MQDAPTRSMTSRDDEEDELDDIEDEDLPGLSFIVDETLTTPRTSLSAFVPPNNAHIVHPPNLYDREANE